MPTDFITFTQAAPEIAAFTGQPAPRGCYQRLKTRAYDGALPAVIVDGRWGFYRKDLPAICEALGLISPPPAKRTRREADRNPPIAA